ncbi:MAG: hypothetical protein NC929_03470, partial [Candidatus Omnitrophica bacterium]|nr:hypothetical protein [Candidatus Omnitrophota bacterium]
MIVKDLAELGVTEILFDEQDGRGGPFLHPTEVKNASPHNNYMRGRDFLKELLEETSKYNINVYLVWTTPAKGEDVKTEMYDIDYGLESPELRKVYKDLIKEIGEKYKPKYKNLIGIKWHELDCSEAVDNHEDDVDEFRRFCKERFGEEYKEKDMPKRDSENKWWRRYVLWRNEIMNSFVKEMADEAKKYNLKTMFCFYTPEAYHGESWKWGYDIIGLEKICDHIWFLGSGYTVETGKFYQSIKGSVIDFGPSYSKQILGRNYSYAFHGLPLNYFEYRTSFYIKEMRAYYSSYKDFTKKYGDYYTGYAGQPEKAIELFYGKDNLKNWLNLMVSFQPGESPSSIAVSINPMPFVLKYPFSPGVEYGKKVRSLMEGLTGFFDVDGFISGSLRMDENLKKYSFVIIPEDMAIGLREDVYDKYLRYVKEGGKLLIINTPITIGNEDLTELKDKTEEIAGIKIKGKNAPKNIAMENKEGWIKCSVKKVWTESSDIEVKSAEVILKEKNTQMPILTMKKIGKGVVYFSSISFNSDIASYFASIINRELKTSINLESKEIRILESVKKGDKLAIALWGTGKGILKVDTRVAGIKAENIQVKEILTGKIIRENIKAELLAKEGVEVNIKYVNQPYIVAIGSKKELRVYKGIYNSEDVFAGLVLERIKEHPEVPIMVPEGKGPRIGVYHGGWGTESIIKVLEKEGMRVFSLPRLDADALSYYVDVLIIPQCYNSRFFNQAIKEIREFVERGGGLLLTHDAVGYREHEVVFPEIGKGIKNPFLDKVKIVKNHPVTEGFRIGEEIEHKYYDHVGME